MDSKDTMDVVNIPISEIYCDQQFNCRGAVQPIDVLDLVKSIELNGLLQPITLQTWTKTPGKKYRIVTGHRRFTAFLVLKRAEIPAIVRTDLTEVQARTLNLMENLSRKDLNIMQEAKAIEFYKKAGYTQFETADLTGCSRGWIQVRFMVLDFPEDVQKEIAAGFVNQTQIRDLHGLPPEQIYEAIKDIKTRREKGDKTPITYKPQKVKGTTKRERGRQEILGLQSVVYDLFGPGLLTRVMAWASGEISDFDIQCDIRDEAEKIGKLYVIPKDYLTW